ncbi:MAG: lamin tail domain-containing protein [Myxococcales bacterium]|nr:lamin tail domain-containing protein [Myxococcales bacterium]
MARTRVLSAFALLNLATSGFGLLQMAACGSESKIDHVNAQPDVDITSPLYDAVWHQGVDGIVEATVSDGEDGPEDLEVTWSLDGASAVPSSADSDGNVSAPLDASTLELGEHVIDVTVTDRDAATATASVTFTVAGPLGAPNVVITAPEDGTRVTTGTAITFTGEGNDGSTAGDDLVFSWSSDLDGDLAGAISGDGQSVLLTDSLTANTHMITLHCLDTDGEAGSDSITLTVSDEPIEAEPGDLIFTEVMVDPNAVEDEYGEYVELYNTSGSTLDLANYSLHDDGVDEWIFDSSVLVASHAYVVICANLDPAVNGGVLCDAAFYRNPNGAEPAAGLGHGAGMAIANNDDELELTSPLGIDIDVFDYNDTTSDPIESGMAFGLDPNMLDGVLNDDVAHWCVQTTVPSGMIDAGTPGAQNDPCDGM